MRLNTPNTFTLSKHWVGRGLKNAWTGAMPYTCTFSLANGAKKSIGAYGLQHECLGTDSSGAAVSPKIGRPSGRDCSMGVLIDQTAQNFNNGSSYITFPRSVGYATVAMFLTAASTSLNYWVTDSAGTSENITSATGVFDPTADTKWHWIEIKRFWNTVYYYVDGVLKDTKATATKIPDYAHNPAMVVYGNPSTNTFNSGPGSCACAFFFDRFVPDTTLIRANPSTLFEPVRKQMIYAPAAAAAVFKPAWVSTRSRVISAGGSL